MEWSRPLAAVALAALAAAWIDRATAARGLSPPGFASPWRRGLGALLLAAVFYIAIFASVAAPGEASEIDLEALRAPQLFFVHALLVTVMIGWMACGYAGWGGGLAGWGRLLARQLGLAADRPLHELAIGLGLGLLAWPLVLLAVAALAVFLYLVGGADLLPSAPPPLVPWIAALPFALRAGISLSAGVVEELFFRGLLQPRAGVAASTLLFVLAHASYEQPLMLVGVGLLSLFFAGLVAWRQNVWPAVVAHFLFDGLQLLFLIPWALERWPAKGLETVALLAGLR